MTDTNWMRAPQRLRVPKKEIERKRTKRPTSWFIEEKKAADEAYRDNFDTIFRKKEQDVTEIKLPPPSNEYRNNYDEIFRRKQEEAEAEIAKLEADAAEAERQRIRELKAFEAEVEAHQKPSLSNETGRELDDFDYLRYDETSQAQSNQFKQACVDLKKLTMGLGSPFWKGQARLKLNEFYMCIGKAIRDDQVERTGAVPLQEERTNS